MTLAAIIVWAAGLYLAAGLIVAASALVRGLGRIDPDAENATLGFRILVIPGLVLMWPVIIRRIRSGRREPPRENTAHKRMWPGS
jgi:hypothetical protein